MKLTLLLLYSVNMFVSMHYDNFNDNDPYVNNR